MYSEYINQYFLLYWRKTLFYSFNWLQLDLNREWPLGILFFWVWRSAMVQTHLTCCTLVNGLVKRSRQMLCHYSLFAENNKVSRSFTIVVSLVWNSIWSSNKSKENWFRPIILQIFLLVVALHKQGQSLMAAYLDTGLHWLQNLCKLQLSRIYTTYLEAWYTAWLI